ncbi:MAG: hypothetical protein HKN24_11335 [Acidimicrobiales bacterium]|nr:hypothetical protein [Acidimicrobiales bacterium]
MISAPAGERRRSPWFVPALITLAVVAPFAVFGEFSPPDNRATAVSFAIVSIALLALDPMLPVPATVVLVALGARFGLVTGALCGSIGLIAGTIVGLVIGRSMAQPIGDRFNVASLTLGLGWSDPAAVGLTRGVPVLAETTAIMAGMRRAPVAQTLLWATLAAVGLATLSSSFGVVGRNDHPVWALVGIITLPCFAALPSIVSIGRNRERT